MFDDMASLDHQHAVEQRRLGDIMGHAEQRSNPAQCSRVVADKGAAAAPGPCRGRLIQQRQYIALGEGALTVRALAFRRLRAVRPTHRAASPASGNRANEVVQLRAIDSVADIARRTSPQRREADIVG